MKKGSTVVHWTKDDDLRSAQMRKKGETWESVAAAVSTKKTKRSAEATMQRARYIAGKQKKSKRTPKMVVRNGYQSPPGSKVYSHAPKTPPVQREFAPESMPLDTKSIVIGGQTFSLPRV